MNKTTIFLAFISVFLPLTAQASFSDVSKAHNNYDAIDYMQAQGIVSGYADGTFQPSSNINRAEFTKIIIEAVFDQNEIDNCFNANIQANWTYIFFADITRNDWFAKYICIAKVKNIVSGYPDGTFKASNNISFAEAAKIISNAFNLETNDEIPWYAPFITSLSEKGVIPVSIQNINQLITRGEMVEMIYRIKTNMTEKEQMRYEDGKLTKKIAEVSEAEKFCIDNHGKVGERNECDKVVKTCILKDETECGLDDYFKGYCTEGVLVEWGEACRGSCEEFGGKVSDLIECNGEISRVCNLSDGEACYLENFNNGKCEGIFSPKVMCDQDQ